MTRKQLWYGWVNDMVALMPPDVRERTSEATAILREAINPDEMPEDEWRELITRMDQLKTQTNPLSVN